MPKSIKLTFNADGYAPSYVQEESDGKLSIQEVNETLGLTAPRFIELGPVMIFKEGEWNGNPYDRADIMEMVDNFDVMRGTWTPTLKVSHAKGMYLMDDESTEEADGRIVKMWQEEGIIYANMAFEIPFYINKIAGKRLNHKSVEIWPSMEYNKVEFNNVISNVALLGISMPGCGDLGEIENENTRYRIYTSNNTKGEPIVFKVNEEGNDLMANTTEVDQVVEELDITPEADVVETPEEEVVTPEAEETVETEEEVVETPEAELEADLETEEIVETPEDVVVEEIVEEVVTEEAPLDVEPIGLSLNDKIDNSLKATFERQLEAMEAKFMAQYEAQNAVIEEFKKERVETKVNNDLENLIREGHVKPANRELCKSLFMALDTSDKVNFSIGEDVVEDASTLLKHLLKTYSVWQSDATTEGDSIDEEVNASLPVIDQNVTVNYRGKELPADNVQEDAMARELQKTYAASGKKVPYWDCYLEVRAKIRGN